MRQHERRSHFRGGAARPQQIPMYATAAAPPASAPYFGGGLQATLRGVSPEAELPKPEDPPEAPGGGLSGFYFWVRLLFVLAWASILVGGFFYKITEDSLANVAQHLTNWAWNLNALFYTLDVLSHLDPTGRMAIVNVSGFFWMIHGLSWAVFWLMFVVLQDNPDLLLEASDRGGGDLPLGTVFTGDRLFHVLPALFNSLYGLLLARYVVRESVNWLSGPEAPMRVRVLYGLWAPVISALLPVGIYLASFDPIAIYGLNVSEWVLVAVGLGAVLLFNLLPYVGFVLAVFHSPSASLLA